MKIRKAEITRKTAETEVSLQLNVDGSGIAQVASGIAFLDHMLHHLAVHGLFDLQVQASGDLDVDVHHTLEDTALALGDAFAAALGDRAGIVRCGWAHVPMDESLAFVCVDLSGRPYPLFEATWHTPYVGGVPTSLFAHFFESLAFSLRANLHARVVYGRDDHHQAEALFKALGRALDAATRLDARRGESIPSTKGSLA